MNFRLDADSTAFIEAGRSITVAAAGRSLRPSVAKAVGCVVEPTADELRLFLVGAKAHGLLADLEATWRVAAVFSQPSTHRTLQLKGRVLGIESPGAADILAVQRQMEGFAADLRLIGYPREFPSTFLGFERESLRAIRMSIEIGFHQTPGPGAGRPLPGSQAAA